MYCSIKCRPFIYREKHSEKLQGPLQSWKTNVPICCNLDLLNIIWNDVRNDADVITMLTHLEQPCKLCVDLPNKCKSSDSSLEDEVCFGKCMYLSERCKIFLTSLLRKKPADRPTATKALCSIWFHSLVFKTSRGFSRIPSYTLSSA